MRNSTTTGSLERSIIVTLVSYFFVQCAIYAGFSVPGGFFGSFALLFFASSTGFHLFLVGLLLKFKADFVKEASGEVLTRVNLANRITLIRVSTLPTLLALVLAARRYPIRLPLVVLVVFVFATDFADGFVSRKANEVTRAGRMLDSASDYSLIIVLSVVFQYYGLIPVWLNALVLSRLGIQAVFVAILAFAHRRIEPRSTFMGKVAIASIMVLYSIEVLDLVSGGAVQGLAEAAEWVVAAIVLASVADKALNFAQALREGAHAIRE